MDSLKPEITIKIFPRKTDLLGKPELKCTVSDCNSTFHNKSNLQMHLEKRHKIFSKTVLNLSNDVQYYCPQTDCKYNISQEKANFFSSKKLLKQHFLKVHATKNVACKKCDRKFSTNSLKMQHERACGKLFQCMDCDLSYTSRECLLTHCRRKNHKVPAHVPERRKKLAQSMAVNHTKQVFIKPKIFTEADIKAILHNPANVKNQRKVLNRKPLKTSKGTQTELNDFDNSTKVNRITQTVSTRCDIQDISKPLEKYKNLDLTDEESNTISSHTFKNLNSMSFVEEDSSLSCFVNTNSSLCHIETQTELITRQNTNSIDSGREMDPLLCHMHTQTSDEILTELGLADIETQTNWPNDDYGELFVSAETQTCFSSFIMDNNSTQTQNMSDLGDSSFLFKPSPVPYFESVNRCTQIQQTE